VKHHPSSVDQLLIKQLISELDPGTTLLKFLTRQFTSIDRALALGLLKELGEGFHETMVVKEIDLNKIRQIHRLFQQIRFKAPDGSCLSPAGEYNLRLGIMKELQPMMVSTFADATGVYEGHPFIVEAAVSLGGANVKHGINVFRFANRIPLLFEGGNDVATKTASSIKWSNYKISLNNDRIGVFCSIVSTKIPFKGTGKEYIADDADEIKRSVRRALHQCCVQLKVKLMRKAALKSKAERKKQLIRYVPDVANCLMTFFSNVVSPSESEEMTKQVKTGRISQTTFVEKLTSYVELVDREQMLDGPDESDEVEMIKLCSRGDALSYSPVVLFGPGTDVTSCVRAQFLSSLEMKRV